jgi:hypothetical protein
MRKFGFIRWVPALALGIFLAVPFCANAQTSPQPAQKQKKAAGSAKAAAPEALTLEPRAIEILKTTSARLASAQTVSFTAVETFESLSRQGAPLVYANKFEVTMQRPDKLKVILAGDGPVSEFYDDGKTVMAFAPAENLVAITDAQPTIDKTLESVYRSAAIYFPFTDIIVTDPYGDMAPGLKHAYYVGQSKVLGGITTDIVAFAGNGIFAEMWVGADDKLPRAIHAIYLDDPDHLRHNLIFSEWQLEPTVTADAFTSSTAASAKRMPFAHPNAQPGPGARPPKKANPSSPQ